MKKLLTTLVLLGGLAFGQTTKTTASQNGNNTFSGNNTFTGTVTNKLVDGVVQLTGYGAYCDDGVHDDTAALTAAINAVKGSNKGGVIMLPDNATCAMNAVITDSTITVRGHGRRASWIKQYDNTKPALKIDATSTSVVGITLDNFGCTGNGSTVSDCIEVTGTQINDNHTFSNLYIGPKSGNSPQFRHGINVNGRLIYGKFNNVVVSNTTQQACYFSGPGPINFLDIRLMGCMGSTGSYGFWLESTNVSNIVSVAAIDLLDAEGNATGGVYLKDVQGVTFRNPYVENNGTICSPACTDGYSFYVTGTYAVNTNIEGGLAWGSGNSIYWDANLSQGGIKSVRVSGQISNYNVSTSNASSAMVIGPNYEGPGTNSFSGNITYKSTTGSTFYAGGISWSDSKLRRFPTNRAILENGSTAVGLAIAKTTDAAYANIEYMELGNCGLGAVFAVCTRQNGTGASQPLYLGTTGANFLAFITNNVVRGTVGSGGGWTLNGTLNVQTSYQLNGSTFYDGTQMNLASGATYKINGSQITSNDLANYRKVRVAATATAAALGSQANTTVTWPSAFADTNYTATCMIEGTSGVPAVLEYTSKAASSIVVTIEARSAAAAGGNLNCIAFHD